MIKPKTLKPIYNPDDAWTTKRESDNPNVHIFVFRPTPTPTVMKFGVVTFTKVVS